MNRVFIVLGYWNTQDTDGSTVVKVTWNLPEALDSLEDIAKSKAAEFVELRGSLSEDISSTHYEVMSASGYAKFYVIEQTISQES